MRAVAQVQSWRKHTEGLCNEPILVNDSNAERPRCCKSNVSHCLPSWLSMLIMLFFCRQFAQNGITTGTWFLGYPDISQLQTFLFCLLCTIVRLHPSGQPLHHCAFRSEASFQICPKSIFDFQVLRTWKRSRHWASGQHTGKHRGIDSHPIDSDKLCARRSWTLSDLELQLARSGKRQSLR